MFKLWVWVASVMVVSSQQPDNVFPANPPSPQATLQAAFAAAGRTPHRTRPPSPPAKVAAAVAEGPQLSTTPVPILVDSRSIDIAEGSFTYKYVGGDGSTKFESRYPNGTVVGNYTFINDLGEKETRTYTAGMVDPSLVDETTDPNYVDLSNYDLYKHLERPYVDDADTQLGTAEVVSRPTAQASRPRPQVQQQPRPQPTAPAGHSQGAAHFAQPVFTVATFDVGEASEAALGRAAPSSRGRAATRPASQQVLQRPRHRLDLASTSSSSSKSGGSLLDSVI